MNKKITSEQIVSDVVEELLKQKMHAIISIDGMSGSGKTTFAESLAQKINATIIHMDDFFLRPEQRTEERLKTPGGNVDVERMVQEIIIPVTKGESFVYKPFDCHTMSFKDEIIVKPANIVIIEGSYSCHPQIFDYCDLHIFLQTDRNTQINRIISRCGKEKARVFADKWIPLENTYFEYFRIPEKCELKFST